MSLFKKSKKEDSIPELPRLPSLPSLPELPNNDFSRLPSLENEEFLKEKHTQLPSFPNNKFADKFSQDNIKNAIIGQEKEVEEEGEEIPKPKKEKFKMEEPEEKDAPMEERFIPIKEKQPILDTRNSKDEPIFIRLDKFEESSNIFEKIKIKTDELNELLKENKELKEKENQEIQKWESEMQKLKAQIEKIDQDIFSKLE